MKIVHTSDIKLGASFAGFGLAGDKLRAGLKTTFSKIVDFTLNEKADMLLIAGNIFDSHEISKNLQDFVAKELRRLDPKPVIVLPGPKDHFGDSAFWHTWEGIRKPTNIHFLADKKRPFIIIPELGCAVYGLAPTAEDDNHLSLKRLGPLQDAKYHLAVACAPLVPFDGEQSDGLLGDLLGKYDYVALGGQPAFLDLSCPGYRAAFSGAPEALGFAENNSGNIVVIQINEPKNVLIAKAPIGHFQWKSIELQAKEIANNDELLRKIKQHAGRNILLNVKLTGLALFEAGLDPGFVQTRLSDDFLHLNIDDEMIVFPENIAEVKVSEKTVVGQYLRLMAQKLKAADDKQKQHLEQSIKIGYSLLSGRELW